MFIYVPLHATDDTILFKNEKHMPFWGCDMLEIRTADGTGRGTIDKTFSARGNDGKRYEAARYSLRYADGRTLEFFTDGQELKNGIARGDIKIYGRILNS